MHSPFRPREPHFSSLSGREQGGFQGVVDVKDAPILEERGYKHDKRMVIVSEPGATPVEVSDYRLALDCYDAGIAYADEQLAVLYDFLDESGLGETTAVVVTSDHGEAFGEKGLASHSCLYDFNLMVPVAQLQKFKFDLAEELAALGIDA